MQRLLLIKLLLLISVAAGAAFAGNAASANDPVTGLPVYPGLTDPDPLPRATLCGKAMQGDFYVVMGNNVGTVVSWYAKRLPSYKKFHAVTDHRSQDTFFSSDGRQEVTVTGSPNSTEVYSISYGLFQPGLSPSQMASFNTGKHVCK